MNKDIDLSNAKRIVRETAEQRAQWGRHAGVPPSTTEAQLLDALVDLHESGILDVDDDVDKLREDIVKANRQKGAAESRAKKYKKLLDELIAQQDEGKQFVDLDNRHPQGRSPNPAVDYERDAED